MKISIDKLWDFSFKEIHKIYIDEKIAVRIEGEERNIHTNDKKWFRETLKMCVCFVYCVLIL